MLITPAQIQPIAALWQTALNQLTALISVAAVSLPGTQVTGPNSTTFITDAAGVVWGMGASASGPNSAGQFFILMNGAQQGGYGQYIEIDTAGIVWTFNSVTSVWFKWSGSGWSQPGVAPVTK
jgi:hypothetical protein